MPHRLRLAPIDFQDDVAVLQLQRTLARGFHDEQTRIRIKISAQFLAQGCKLHIAPASRVTHHDEFIHVEAAGCHSS